MKKISLIASLLFLTTTQSLLLMELTEHQFEDYRQYTTSVVQEYNNQMGSFYTLDNTIEDSENHLIKLWSELTQATNQLPVYLQKIQETKAKEIDLKEALTQSLEIQRAINNNGSIIKKAITSAQLISDEKERDKVVEKLTNDMQCFQETTIFYTEMLACTQTKINNLEARESLIENTLKRRAKTIAFIKNIIINAIALYLLIAMSQYIYKNYNGDVSLLLKKLNPNTTLF